MTKQNLPILFNALEVLDVENHKSLKISKNVNFKHSENVHSIPIVIGEVPFVAKEYPVSFVKIAENTYTLVAVVGFQEGNNAFVDESGQWLAEYVPLYVRKYPFIGVGVEGHPEKKVMCVDTKAPHFSGKDSENLFNKKGEPTEILKVALKMAEDFDVSSRQTDAFCAEMEKAGVLEIKHEVSAFGNIQYYGFNLDALTKLSVKKASEWQENGFMAMIHHINSSNRGWREIELRMRLKTGVENSGSVSGRA